MSGFDNVSMDSGPDPEFQFNDINSKMSMKKKSDALKLKKPTEELKQDDID
jgi:hypothetical protein